MKPLINLLIVALLFFSCTKDELQIISGNQSNTIETDNYLKILQTDKTYLTLKKIDQNYIMSNDILLTQQQVEIIKSNILNKGAGIGNLSNHWTNSIVYYTIDPSLPNPNRVHDAIDHYRNVAPFITFVERTNQPNYIEFVRIDGTVSYSYVGMIGGRQTIQLSDVIGIGVTIHEIGHALGLFHEHTRTDRNNFIRINYQNIDPEFTYAFDTYAQRGYNGFNNGPFDYNSRMLYSSTLFSINGQRTIERLDGLTYTPNCCSLSLGDIDALELIYKPVYAKLRFKSIDIDYGDPYCDYALDEVSVHFFSDPSFTNPVNLPRNITLNYQIKRYEQGTQLSNASRNLNSGKQSYILDSSFVVEDCCYDYGDPEPGCYSQDLSLRNGIGYRK